MSIPLIWTRNNNMAIRIIEFGTLPVGVFPPTPPDGRKRLFFDSSGNLSVLSSNGSVALVGSSNSNASLLTSGTLPDARLSSNIARTSDVTGAVAAVVNAAPASLDTLKELADALGNDASFASTVTNSLASKAPINNPTFTGTVGGVTKSMVGLGDVDNTSDANKPISTATQTALDEKANKVGNVRFHSGTVTLAGGVKVQTNLDLDNGAAINVTGAGSRISFTQDTAQQTRTNLGAAAEVHTHPLSALTQSGASLQQVAQWDGTQWSPATVPAAGSLPVSELFTTSGTWTKPSGARLVEIICVGGGGAGGDGGQLGATPFLITSSDPVGFTITTQEPHGFANGNIVRFRGLTGTPGRGDMETAPFYVLNATTNSFSISAVSGGPGVNPGSLTGGVVYRIASAMSGGGGGGGGGVCRLLLPASLLNATEPVTVGAGGTRITTAGASFVGSLATRIIARASQGGNGANGTSATPATGGAAGLHGGNLGPNSSVTGAAGNGFFSWQTGLSGGAGGGISVTGAGFNGGYGAPSVANSSSLPLQGVASSSNSNSATSGADGLAPANYQLIFGGSSGAGGGAQTHLDKTPSNSLMSGAGGNGGNAKPDMSIPGNYGCGGGGGGACIANRGGYGGVGSAGAVLITTF